MRPIVCVEAWIWGVKGVFVRIDGIAQIFDFASKETTADAVSHGNVQLVAPAGSDTAAGGVHPKDGVAIAAQTLVVGSVPIAGEGAAVNLNMRTGENGKRTGTVFFIILETTLAADVVDADVGDIADEETVFYYGGATW